MDILKFIFHFSTNKMSCHLISVQNIYHIYHKRTEILISIIYVSKCNISYHLHISKIAIKLWKHGRLHCIYASLATASFHPPVVSPLIPISSPNCILPFPTLKSAISSTRFCHPSLQHPTSPITVC